MNLSISAALVSAAQTGDQGAVQEILEKVYGSVATLCHRICANSSDAEDATQEALISIATNLEKFRNDSQLTTWVYRIAYNAAIDEVRRSGRRPLPSEMSDEQIDAIGTAGIGSSADDALAAAELRLDINAALNQLEPEFRNVFILREISQLDYQSIAEITGVPVGTIRSRIARARKKMITILDTGNFWDGSIVRVERHD